MKISIGGKNDQSQCIWVEFDYDIELVNRIKSVGYNGRLQPKLNLIEGDMNAS